MSDRLINQQTKIIKTGRYERRGAHGILYDIDLRDGEIGLVETATFQT